MHTHTASSLRLSHLAAAAAAAVTSSNLAPDGGEGQAEYKKRKQGLRQAGSVGAVVSADRGDVSVIGNGDGRPGEVRGQDSAQDVNETARVRFVPNGGEFFHSVLVHLQVESPGAEVFYSLTPISDLVMLLGVQARMYVLACI